MKRLNKTGCTILILYFWFGCSRGIDFSSEFLYVQDGHGIQQEQHQIGKPNLDHEPVDNIPANKEVDSKIHGGDSNHDNRIENQGPVNLQVSF